VQHQKDDDGKDSSFGAFPSFYIGGSLGRRLFAIGT